MRRIETRKYFFCNTKGGLFKMSLFFRTFKCQREFPYFSGCNHVISQEAFSSQILTRLTMVSTAFCMSCELTHSCLL